MTYSLALPDVQADRPIICLPLDADYCPVGNLYAIQKRATAAIAWTTANVAVYYEFYIAEVTTIYKIGWMNGTAVATNICVAIYNNALARLATTGAVARAGTSVVQWSDIADLVLQPGTYHCGVNVSATTASNGWGDLAANHALGQGILENVREQNVGATALPDPAVPVTLTAVRAHQLIYLATQTGLS